jgi:hypothetical protein
MNGKGNEPQLGDGRTYLTLGKAVEYLGVTPQILISHCDEIPFYIFDGRVFYTKEDLDDIIRRNKQEGML